MSTVKHNITCNTMLKFLALLILSFALCVKGFSQRVPRGGWTNPNPASYGEVKNRVLVDKFFGVPTADTVPTTLPAYDMGVAGLQYNTSDTSLFVFDPIAQMWLPVRGGGSGGVNITNAYSLFGLNVFRDTLNLTGSTKHVVLPHGLGYVPNMIQIKVNNDEGNSSIPPTADANNVYIDYPVAPVCSPCIFTLGLKADSSGGIGSGGGGFGGTDTIFVGTDTLYIGGRDTVVISGGSGGDPDSLGGKRYTEYEIISNKSANAALGISDLFYPTQHAVKTYVDNGLASKQSTLVSGVNIKSINNQSLLGSGNINITGGTGGGTTPTDESFHYLTDASNTILDYNTGRNFYWLIGGNRTLLPTNVVAGRHIFIKVTSDVAGNRVITFPPNSLMPLGVGATGTTLPLSTAGSSIDAIDIIYDGAYYIVGISKNLSTSH